MLDNFMRSAAMLAAFIIMAGCAPFANLHLKDCRTVSGMPGPEDFVVDSNGGATRLLVSSQERRNDAHFKTAGGIFSVPVIPDGLGTPRGLPLANRDGLPFHPHGISLTKSGGKTLLYVINHQTREKHVVEIFRVEANRLVFVKRLRDDLLFSPNDLKALPDGQIYVTNDHGYRGFVGFVENLFGAGWSNVVHYRAGVWKEAASGIAFANGVEVNRSGDRLYVAAVRDGGVHVYHRDVKTGAVSKRKAFWDLSSGADNLMWENDVSLIVAAHPKLFAFLSHAKDAADHSPTQVFRINVGTGRVEKIFADDGRIIDAAATSLIFRGRLIISGVFDPDLVSCRAR